MIILREGYFAAIILITINRILPKKNLPPHAIKHRSRPHKNIKTDNTAKIQPNVNNRQNYEYSLNFYLSKSQTASCFDRIVRSSRRTKSQHVTQFSHAHNARKKTTNNTPPDNTN
jgi:hypothetical protein